MWKAIRCLVFFGVIGVLGFFACTENPLSSGRIFSGIRGQVSLSEDLSPENIYVWMEKWQIATRTDDHGEFLLNLPPVSTQGGSGGISGLFTACFYAAHYQLATVETFDNTQLFRGRF
ncbi:MAG: hypothetical protein ACE5HS_00530 [bacterium]